MGRILFHDDDSDTPKTDRVQSGGNVGHAAVIREFLIDVRFPYSSYSGDLLEFRSNLRGRLGCWIEC